VNAKRRRILWLLVVNGPLAITQLAKQAQLDRDYTYNVVYQMTNHGWVKWSEPHHWVATRLGRRTVTQAERDAEREPATPLFDGIGQESHRKPRMVS